MVPDIVIGLMLGIVVGFFVGCAVYYYIGTPKCNHQFEEVLNTIIHGKHVVVHMCKKCGKRKITKV
jgi:hypothetical protein